MDLVSEYNGTGVLLHFPEYLGAYTRGKNEAEAVYKAPDELKAYTAWAKLPMPDKKVHMIHRVRAKENLQISDADSEILLDCDTSRFDEIDFDKWCGLSIFSARCVAELYDSINDKEWAQPEKMRPTFYGKTPSTATEMLMHIDQVSGYYLSRIGIKADFEKGKLIENRERCMELLHESYAARPFNLFECDGEYWTESKVLRRYLWHDRLHAKAMFRHGIKSGMSVNELNNPFHFSV